MKDFPYLYQVLYLRSAPPLTRDEAGDENVNRSVVQRAARDFLLDRPTVLTDRIRREDVELISDCSFHPFR